MIQSLQDTQMRLFLIVLLRGFGFKNDPKIVKESMNVCKMRPFVILLPKCNFDKYDAEKRFKNGTFLKIVFTWLLYFNWYKLNFHMEQEIFTTQERCSL